jgi:hypothetical protein
MAELFTNAAQSTLTSGISNSATSLTVASAAAFPATGNFRILVDQELMLVTSVSSATFTVTRAVEAYAGTQTAVLHASGATVTHVLTAASVPLASPVASVSNSDGTLTISPTTGAVVASLALGHANTWTATQTFNLNTASAPTPSTGTGVEVVGTDATIARAETTAFGANAAVTLRRADGTGAAPTAIQSGDVIGAFNWHGYYVMGGPGWSNAMASIEGVATQAWTNAAQGTKLVLFTTPNGSTTLTTAVTIGQDQSMTVVGPVTASNFTGHANPSATIGLSAVNGTATTSMTSDSAPPLSQAIAPTWTHSHTWTVTQAANTSVDGIVLADTTVASAGNQQFSPRLRLTGQGWATAAGGSSQEVDWIAEVQPVQGAAAPTGNLVFSNQVAGGGYATTASLSSSGTLALPASSTITSSGGTFTVNSFSGTIMTAGGSARQAFISVNFIIGSAGSIGFNSVSTVNAASTADTTLARNSSGPGLVVSCSARSAISTPYFAIQTPADTTLTASTPAPGIQFGGNSAGGTVVRQFTTGSSFSGPQVENNFVAPTYSAVAASTVTEADTLYVKAPIAGTNVTLTRSNAIVSEGQLTVRQVGGTAGVKETQIWNDGTFGYVDSATGNLVVGPNFHQVYFGASGTGGQPVAAAGGGNEVNAFACRAAGQYQWANVGDASGTKDTGLKRVAASVVGPTDGSSSGKGWFQDTAGEAALLNAYTNATATLGNTNISPGPLIAGRSYRIDGFLIVSNSVVAEGVQFDCGGGSGTATTFAISATTGDGSTVTPGTTDSTSLTGAINYTAVTGTAYIYLRGYIKCGIAGTFILRFAENTHVTGTATLGAGSWIALYDTIPM